MKFKTDKAGWDALSTEHQAFYKPDGEEGFVLIIEGLPQQEDVTGLKAKNTTLLAEKAELKEKQAIAITKAVEAALSKAKDDNDIDALETSWQTKYGSKVAMMQGIIDGLNSSLTDVTSGSEATKLASAIAVAGSAEVLLPHIQKRLRTEMKEGVPVTVVLGADGKQSAMTIEELSEEFKGNKSFAGIIAGTKAVGKGIHQQDKLPAGQVDLSGMSAEGKLSYAREHPET